MSAITHTFRAFGWWRFRTLTAFLCALVNARTGYRFPATFRHGVTRRHRTVYRLVSTVASNYFAEEIRPQRIVRALVRLDWRDPYTDAEYVADALAHLAPDVELAEPDPCEREDTWLLDAYFPAGTDPEAVRAALEPWPYDIETDAVPKGAT